MHICNGVNHRIKERILKSAIRILSCKFSK